MATANGNSQFVQQGVLQSTWTLTSANDTGTPEELARYPYHSVQMTGTFGGTVILEGSDDGVTYFTLQDRAGNNISATSNARFDTLAIVPEFVRFRVSVSSVTSVVCIITSRTNVGH